jgi:hypothetical protein
MELDSNQGTEQNTLGGAAQNQDLSTANGEGLETSGEGSYKPFANGKEKFSVDGEDVEMDWEEAKKSIQLAKASYKRFEEANGIRQSAQQSYQKMMELARTNPEGLLRVLNPNWQPGTQSTQRAATQQYDQRATEQEQPWQTELERIKAENEEFRSKFENLELDRERAALQQEFQAIETKYPVFKDKLANNFLKTEYRKALRAGMDVDLETVAFYANQEIQQSKTAQVQNAQKNIQQKRSQAPVSSQPAGGDGKKKGFSSFEELKNYLGK